MTIIKSRSTLLDDVTIPNATMPFVQADETSSFTIVETNGRTVGISFDTDPAPHLRFSPDWQLPEGARDKEQWNRFEFDCEDERVMDVHIDFRDGEIKYIELLDKETASDPDKLIEAVVKNCDWITQLYPRFVEFTRQQLVDRD